MPVEISHCEPVNLSGDAGNGVETVVLVPDRRQAIAADLAQVQAVLTEATLAVVGVARDGRELEICARAGVLGAVLEDDSVDELVRTVEHVIEGRGGWTSEAIAALITHLSTDRAEEGEVLAQSVPSLTAREHEVLGLVMRGMDNSAIARELCIEVPTVKNHVHRILRKTGTRSRYELGRASQGGPRSTLRRDQAA